MERTDELKERIRQQPLNDRLEESRRRIGDMCSKGRCPKMTIPVQYDDDDFYINTTLSDAQATIAALEETILKMGENAAVVAKDAMAAKEQVAALQARVQELEAVLAGDLELTKLHYEPGKPLELQAKHPLIAVMAASMAQMCDDMKAENYVEVQFNHHEKGHFILTVQKMFHPTPHQLRQKAESQLTQRTAECDALKLVNDTHMKTVMKLSHIVEQQTAELEAAKRDLGRAYESEKSMDRIMRIEEASSRVMIDRLRAELERVRGERDNLQLQVHVYQNGDAKNNALAQDIERWRVEYVTQHRQGGDYSHHSAFDEYGEHR